MKHFSKILIVAGALSAPAVVQAQPYNKAHQITVSETKGFTWPTLQKSDNRRPAATDIMALQYLLRNRGFYKSNVDGEFGDLTEKAVRDFQRAKGLKVDGIVGPQTWTPLVLRLKRGDRGDAVRAVQMLLTGLSGEDGFPLYLTQNVDGIYGVNTIAGVRSFQKEWGIYYKDKGFKVDGIVGARTWAALLGAKFDR